MCYRKCDMGKAEGHSVTFTSAQFKEWLYLRYTTGDSLQDIGRMLGVSRQSVNKWLSGTNNPSKTVLILAARLAQGPLELSSGLPS